ncbi:MAG: synthase, partial [Pseudomonadota bacterium]
MSLDWSSLALQTVNFLVLVWLLQRFLYRPVLAAIDRRRGPPPP